MSNKSYILDTNILIDDKNCIVNLRNGEENNIIIPNTVIQELDELKDKKSYLKNRIFSVLEEMEKHKDEIKILYNDITMVKNKDDRIIEEILHNLDSLENPIFITNDKILKFKAYKKNITVETYKTQIPFKYESEEYTGFVDIYDKKVNNCFYWDKGKLKFYSKYEDKTINYQNEPWKIQPLNHYQNCFLDLILNDNIDLVSVQSEPGKGKTFLALAAALYLVFEKKEFEKIYVVKSNYEIGNDLGFLPGSIDEKMFPYFKPVHNLISKLLKYRNLPKKAFDENNMFGLNKKHIEFLPLNYLRGMDFENCIIICEEFQNLSREDTRSILSRMGDNVKCICTGDVHQIDNPYLTTDNNGINWIVKKLKGASNYAHIVLRGKQTRGPICQLVIDKKL